MKEGVPAGNNHLQGSPDPSASCTATSDRCKNTETRNIFNPSYEIFASCCEIIMKIVNYCGKLIKNHEKITK